MDIFELHFFFLPPAPPLVLSLSIFLFILSKIIFKSSYNTDLYLPPISRLRCQYCRSLEEEAKNWILKLLSKILNLFI